MSESELVNPSQLSTKLEAILYLKAQPLSIQALADYAICEIEEVEEALLMLMQDYAQRNSALEVVESNAGFSLQLREAYMSLVQTIVPTDLGVGALRTLAAIALKGPIPQTQLVELRGSGAYQHVGDLAEEGFVSKRRQSNGRSYSVQVTEKFYQYFEVDELPKLKLKKTARQRRVVEEEDASDTTHEPLESSEKLDEVPETRPQEAIATSRTEDKSSDEREAQTDDKSTKANNPAVPDTALTTETQPSPTAEADVTTQKQPENIPANGSPIPASKTEPTPPADEPITSSDTTSSTLDGP